jgi:hypothetical protein
MEGFGEALIIAVYIALQKEVKRNAHLIWFSISRMIQSITSEFTSGGFTNLRDSNYKPTFDKYLKVIEIDYAILVKV